MEDYQERLLFALNGERIELQHFNPSMTLLTFIRTETEFKGTKLACGEGGCGACVVLLSKLDACTNQVEEVTINSCLVLLGSINHCAVTTIEGLGSSKNNSLHAVQKRFAGFHASQCGFCTPGMCMSVYGSLRQNAGSPADLKAHELEKSIQGNICRCTGYRPILDVCRSFGGDVDVEDLGLNVFWKDERSASLELLPTYNPKDDPTFPEFLAEAIRRDQAKEQQLVKGCGSLELGRKWISAESLEHAFALQQRLGDSHLESQVKLIVGNTSAGVYKDWEHSAFVDISKVHELQRIEESKEGVEIGAAITISKLITVLKKAGETGGVKSSVYRAAVKHIQKIASPHVRNAGSIGGNLVMAQKYGFDSDLATVLLGMGASVKLLVSSTKEVVQTMEEFLAASSSSSLLISVLIPSYCNQETGTLEFKTYRVSPRPLGNAVSYVNAAFLVRYTVENFSGKRACRVESSRLAFGALGNGHAIRASNAEQFLEGKAVTPEIVLEAIRLLKEETGPMLKPGEVEYKTAAITGFFFKFFWPRFYSNHVDNGPPLLENGHAAKSRAMNKGLIRGSQKLHEADKRRFIGKPSEKTMSNLQATGEAVYVDDIPSPSGCLHAAFVYSQKALARIKETITTEAMESPGAVAFVSVKDIPSTGANIGIKAKIVFEKLFAEETVQCVGQAIGVMVADTMLNAQRAAKKVRVVYDTDSLGPPVLTIEDAINRESFFAIPPAFLSNLKTKSGDVQDGFSKADKKIEAAEINTPSQYFFYMETNTALAVPEEDNCFTVYSACQGTELVQETVAACIGVPMHNVRVITRRVGGAFGGKATKSCVIAAACTLAAMKLQKPVRLSMDRKTDMVMIGGREASKAVYNVGYNSDGRVTALEATVYLQAGWSLELTWLFTMNLLHCLLKFNWTCYNIDFKICKSNLPSRTAMRAPGDIQGSFIADTIIEHIAASLGLESHVVMERNIHSVESAEAFYTPDEVGGDVGYTLPKVIEQLKEQSDFERRLESVHEYNSQSMWKKRGLGIVQGTYMVLLVPKPARVSIYPDGSVVVEVGGIEIGQGLWTKVKQAAAFALSDIFDEDEEGISLSKFRVVQADSISMANGHWTAGSTSSEASCEATRMCCEKLVERLKPLKHELEKDGDSKVTWESIAAAAKSRDMELSAQAHYLATPDTADYLIYGAGATEVEVDTLTGETKLLRTDMVYDCGKSMNPAVDIGQIEGAFTHGLGYFMTEDYVVDGEGRLVSDGTWTYKPPTADNLPQVLNIELLNSPAHSKRILSSKASGEPPLLLASSAHTAMRHAIEAARKDAGVDGFFQMDVPATVRTVRKLCGFENVEKYLHQVVKNKTDFKGNY